MNSNRHKTVLVRVQFSDRSEVQPTLAGFGRDPALSVNILRGRVTREDASFELEVTGRERCVEKFLRRSDTLGVRVG